MIETLVQDGTVTLIALGVLALELAGLAIMQRSGRRIADMAANAVSGLFLILALRSALVGYGAGAIAACLGLAFVAHVAGLVARLRK
jgi:hypothetical protein